MYGSQQLQTYVQYVNLLYNGCTIFLPKNLKPICFDFIRSTVINKLKLLEIQYHKQQDADAFSLPEASIQLGRSLNIHMEQIAIEQYRFALHKGPANVFQWKGHSVG